MSTIGLGQSTNDFEIPLFYDPQFKIACNYTTRKYDGKH